MRVCGAATRARLAASRPLSSLDSRPETCRFWTSLSWSKPNGWAAAGVASATDSAPTVAAASNAAAMRRTDPDMSPSPGTAVGPRTRT